MASGPFSSSESMNQSNAITEQLDNLGDHLQDAVTRRQSLASWLQIMVGPLNISEEPTEEELLISLQDGKVFCNLLAKICPGLIPTHDSRDTNNVRKFLSAIAVMNLPLFEVSDLYQVTDISLSCKKVVDCLLSLKSYAESKQAVDTNFCNYDASFKSLRKLKVGHDSSKLYGTSQNTIQKSPFQARRRWIIPESDNPAETDVPLTADDTSVPQNVNSFHHMDTLQKSNMLDSCLPDENCLPTSHQTGTGLTSAHIQHISHKFREILRLKTTSAEESAVLNSLDNLQSQSLSGMVTAVLGDKQQEEVAGLVEYMLKKVLEEFERRLLAQRAQVMKLKNSLKEHLMREDRFASRAKILETLAAGTGEEVKILSRQLQKLKMEKKQALEEKKIKELHIDKLLKDIAEREDLVESLKAEIEIQKEKNKKHIEQLELEKSVFEEMMQKKLNEREVLLEDARRKVEELQAVSAVEITALKKKDEQYQSFVISELQSFKEAKEALRLVKQDVFSLQTAWQDNFEDLEEQLGGLISAASGYHKVLAENRQLYNEVQDLKGNIRVYCRVRPFLSGQNTKYDSVEFIGENGDLLICNPLKPQAKDARRMFNFNKVYRPSATQEEIFSDTQPLIRSVLDGFNVCIFAYGQTGSGKTYTMSGPSSMSKHDWGVNYRALDDLFQISQSRKDVISYEVGVQMIEIYNEQVRDLLFIDTSNRRLEIRNNSQLNGLNVPDACMLRVNSTADVLKLMKIGQKNRAVGATALNERSSRSHSVLTVHVRGTELATGNVLHGCLHLVDLAGSERVDRSEARGDRLKEAQHINKSLSALGDVISALAQKNSHVPYRNSKLTQLLQDSLGGQAKTLMFVHIGPDADSYGETISTLKFAERVASVELGSARRNKESRDLHELKEQVAMLKEVISRKDMEIERLQSTRPVGIDYLSGLEKSKSKTISSPVQDMRMRRQTIDTTGLKEKRLTGRLFNEYGTEQSVSEGLNIDMGKQKACTDEGRESETSISGSVDDLLVEKDIYVQGTTTGETSLTEPLNTVTESMPKHLHKALPRNSSLDFGREGLQDKESDTMSELSEGDNSLAGSEASFSSLGELKASRTKLNRPIDKNLNQRKLSISALPQPRKGEWMSLNGVETYATVRRHSAVTSSSTIGSTTSRKPPSFPVRRTSERAPPCKY
uniref:Kinesin 14-IId protein n=1 Tax=Marsilea vestita TaxID=59764 RepID=A0A142KWD0_MARVE|nr:kinesin 14-IId protein [Marsilea vestita]